MHALKNRFTGESGRTFGLFGPDQARPRRYALERRHIASPLHGIVFRHPMARPPAPHPDEQARMNVLLGLDVLDTTPEEHFDGLVNLGKCASSSSPNSN